MQPRVKLNCLYTTPQILKTLPFIDVILVFFFPTNIDWSEMSTTLFFFHNIMSQIRSKRKKIQGKSSQNMSNIVSVMDGCPSGSNLGNTFFRDVRKKFLEITSQILFFCKYSQKFFFFWKTIFFLFQEWRPHEHWVKYRLQPGKKEPPSALYPLFWVLLTIMMNITMTIMIIIIMMMIWSYGTWFSSYQCR